VEQYFAFINNSLTTLGDGNIIALVSLLAVIVLGEAGIAFPFLVQGILLFFGQRIIANPTLSLIPVALVLLGGRFIGAAGVYWLSRHAGGRVINWLKKRLPAAHKADLLRTKLGKKTFLAIVLARLTPGLLVPTSVASGSMKLHYGGFALGVIVSSIAWDAIFVGTGAFIGKNAEQVVASVYGWITIGAIACTAFALGKILVVRLRKARSATS